MLFERELDVALNACLKAAKLCQTVRATIPATIEKTDQSPVTLADFGSQAIICREIRSQFSEDPIVAEENGDELSKDERSNLRKELIEFVREQIDETNETNLLQWISYGCGKVSPKRFWTLDPIDGTKGFLRKDQYAIALALIVDGDIKLGVLACPALSDDDGRLFYAVRGQGAFCGALKNFQKSTSKRIETEQNRESLCFRFTESIESAHGNHEQQDRIRRKLGINQPSIRVDSQVKYGLVASGQAALYLRLPNSSRKDYRENIWDHAPGAIIVEEAGGRVTDAHGKPLNYFQSEKMNENIGVVVSNGSIHQQVLELLREEFSL